MIGVDLPVAKMSEHSKTVVHVTPASRVAEFDEWGSIDV